MSEEDRTNTWRHQNAAKAPVRPALNRCSACGDKVDLNDDDHHVCVPDDAGTVDHQGRRWRKTSTLAIEKAKHK